MLSHATFSWVTEEVRLLHVYSNCCSKISRLGLLPLPAPIPLTPPSTVLTNENRQKELRYGDVEDWRCEVQEPVGSHGEQPQKQQEEK